VLNCNGIFTPTLEVWKAQPIGPSVVVSGKSFPNISLDMNPKTNPAASQVALSVIDLLPMMGVGAAQDNACVEPHVVSSVSTNEYPNEPKIILRHDPSPISE
jgi:hypothetical protein